MSRSTPTDRFSIKNVNIQTKLALMLTLPILSLLFFSVQEFRLKRSEIGELQQLSDLAAISLRFGDLIHELQKERGRTALFIASKGIAFRKELKLARERTNREEAQLRQALVGFLERQRGNHMAATIKQALIRLDGIDGNRKAVDALNISSASALGFYTDLNANLLDLLDSASKHTRFKDLSNRLSAYLMLLRGKDLIGQERAETGQVFEQKQLSHAKLVRLSELHASKVMFLQRFAHYSNSIDQAFHSREMRAACVGAVQKIQRQLFSGKAVTDIGISSGKWFDLMTCKINRFKSVEEHLGKSLKRVLDNRLTALRRHFHLFIALAGITALLTFFLVFAIVTHLTAQTKRLVQTLHAFSDGNQGVRMTIVSEDELGRIAHSFNAMADRIEENTLKEKERLERERAEGERFKRRIHQLRNTLVQVSDGDLTQRTPEDGNDELSELGHNLNSMIRSLANMSQQIEQTIHALSTSSEQVQQAAHSQSSGASQQAAAINHTSTTLEEIRAVSNQTLEKAQTLGQAAERARQEGEQGRESVEAALAAMRGILKKVDTIAQTILALSERTGHIGEITTAVNNLAQQSKMLALNASIEAAKAGEAGKGFAVVADEVKNLAEQSQQFTTQVHRILEEIRHATDKAVMATEDGAKEVKHGTELTERAGSTVQNLSDILRQNAIAGQQIVAAVRQEAAGIEQIGTAMSEINKVTTQFVASTRQTVQATEDLGQLSGTLRESIRFYKV